MRFIHLIEHGTSQKIWIQASQIIAVREYSSRSRVVCSGRIFEVSEPPEAVLLAIEGAQPPEIVAEPAPER